MGFSLSKAIKGAVGGFLGGGPVGAIAGGALGGFGGDGGSTGKVSFANIPQSPEAIEARKRLATLGFGEPPAVPRRGVAPVEPIGEERQLARETAIELAQPQDFFALPEVQGIIQEAKRVGDLLSNRLSRMLQASGTLTATTGRDVLGRAVSDVQGRLAAELAPFAAEERGRRERLIPQLETLGLTEELRRQGFTQAELDALFQQRTIESRQLETFTIPLLEKIINLQAGVQPIVKGQGPSTLTEFEPLIGKLLEAVLGRGGGDDLIGGMTSPITGTRF